MTFVDVYDKITGQLLRSFDIENFIEWEDFDQWMDKKESQGYNLEPIYHYLRLD